MENKHIHFVGIKGVGMTPLAVIAKEAGYIVSGSDIADGFITDEVLQKNEITPFVGFDASHIEGASLVITTGAHGGYDNVEVEAAKQRGIPVMTQGEAVGEYMKGALFEKNFKGISIAGTHGKTTTTAMIAHIFKDAGLDPSWVIGTSKIPSLGFGGHFGKGNYFIAEADEYANEPVFDKTPKLLLQHPDIAVVTNIEHDHPDVYETIDDVRKTFSQFIHNLPQEGLLVTCGDDESVQVVLQEHKGNSATYGIGEENTFQIQNVQEREDKTEWDVVSDEKKFSFSLSIPGKHNILNATAAYIVALSCGVSVETIQQSLKTFTGTKRRMEYIGRLASGAFLYDDYAHHPTEIQKTLEGFRKKYTNKKLICLFQPHTFSRTKLLFDQFVDSLSLADEVILTNIYASQRESFDNSISSEMLVEKIAKKTSSKLAPTLADVVKYVNQHHYGEDSVIITMGAGDIYTIANQILEHESAPIS